MEHRYLKDVVTLRYDSSLCQGCGLCCQVCPRGVFVMNERTAEVTDRDLCIECGACSKNCAYDAIGVRAGVGCAQRIRRGRRRGDEVVCCD